MGFVGNLMLFAAVKEFRISINSHGSGGTIF